MIPSGRYTTPRPLPRSARRTAGNTLALALLALGTCGYVVLLAFVMAAVAP